VFSLAKLTLLSTVKGHGFFHSRWGITYRRNEPQEIPVNWAVLYMSDDDYEVSFESGDLDDIPSELLARIAVQLGLEESASLTQVKKIVLPQKSKAKKVADTVSALIPKKEESSVEEKPTEEESSEE
jgi:hypothetical protein